MYCVCIDEAERCGRDRHLQGCVDQLGQEYLGKLISTSHEQLSKCMENVIVNANKTSEQNSGASGGVAALAAIAHELLSPGSAKHKLQ